MAIPFRPGSFSFQYIGSVPSFAKGGQGGIYLREPPRNPSILIKLRLPSWTCCVPKSHVGRSSGRVTELLAKFRGYPETLALHCHKLMQHSCGNETQGDRKERVGSA